MSSDTATVDLLHVDAVDLSSIGGVTSLLAPLAAVPDEQQWRSRKESQSQSSLTIAAIIVELIFPTVTFRIETHANSIYEYPVTGTRTRIRLEHVSLKITSDWDCRVSRSNWETSEGGCLSVYLSSSYFCSLWWLDLVSKSSSEIQEGGHCAVLRKEMRRESVENVSKCSAQAS